MWTGGDTTGTFFCSDGTSSVALDNSGTAHLVFGLQRASGDEVGGKFWYPYTDGVVYWNESMPALPEMMNWDSLYAHGNLVGWATDTNVFYADLAYYYNSMTGYPGIIIDNAGHIYCVWAGVTTLLDINNYMLRHIFGVASIDGGASWTDIQDVTDNFLYTWSECVFPYPAKNSTGDFYVIMQVDDEAGLQFYGSQGAPGQVAITQNNMIILTVDKSRFFPTTVEDKTPQALVVSQNFPNPAHGLTTVQVTLQEPASLSVELFSMVGQRIWVRSYGTLHAGTSPVVIDATGLTRGVYFYTIRSHGESVTKKMVVE